MKSGKIFSIEEFSTFDGPGVRMTIFFKGCPMRCMWCHNPESQGFDDEIVRSPNGCLECNACLRVGEEKTGVPSLVEESIGVCPRHLIRHCGEDVTSEELLARVEKKREMLNLCNGGVTFSGGEPLAQPDFLLECLKGLKGKTHRAIQTCGLCDPATFEQILAECDYVLYDLKLIDPIAHQHYTNCKNEKILKNFQSLAKSGKEFITRVPLIPTVTDTEENLTAIAALLKENGVRQVELLPYHKTAGAKYKMLGRRYEITFDPSILPNPHTEIFKNYDIEVKLL